MKKILLLGIIPIMLVGCSSPNVNTNSTIDDRIEALMRAEDLATLGDLDDTANTTDRHFSELDDLEADIDFTLLSETVIFAQLNSLIYMYPEYLGSTIKIKGSYYADVLPDVGLTYHYILMMDSSNCCQGIMEFLLPEGSEYPEVGTELMIFGEYSLDVDETGQYPYVEVSEYVI